MKYGLHSILVVVSYFTTKFIEIFTKYNKIFFNSFPEIFSSPNPNTGTCSIINLCAIALDRFAHIKDPMLYNRWMNKRIVIIAVSIIWILSGLISFLPISLGWHKPLPSTSMVMDRMNDTPLPSSTTTMMTIIESNFDYDDRIDGKFSPKRKQHRRSIDQFDYLNPIFLQLFRQQQLENISKIETIARVPSFELPVSIFVENEQQQQISAEFNDDNDDDEIDKDLDQQQQQQQMMIFANLRHSKHYPSNLVYSQNQLNNENFDQNSLPTLNCLNDDDCDDAESSSRPSTTIVTESELPESLTESTETDDSEFTESNQHEQQWPQCALDLTPTYAVISSCISFYLPCLIMLCLYARLYSICKHHVKTIKSMTKMTTTFQQQQPGFIIVDKQKQQQQNNRLLPGSIQMTINNDDDDDNQIVLDDNNDQKQKNKRNLSSTSTNPVSNLNHHQHQHQSHVSEHKAAITLGIIMGTFLGKYSVLCVGFGVKINCFFQ